MNQYLLIGAASLITGIAQAALVTYQSATLISSNTDFNISLYDGKAGYAGTGATYGSVTGTFGDGTAEAWQLVRNFDDGDTDNVNSPYIEVYTQQGSWGGVPSLENPTSIREYDLFRGDVWTVGDPDTQSADFGGSTWTITGAQNTSTTLDISTYTSGTIYMLVGGYDTIFQTGITMSGTGQTPLTVGSGDIDPPATRNMYVVAFGFDNSAGDYDSIEFSYNGSTSARARYMGVVVDAAVVPEPSAALLGGLGTLILLRRRRA